MTSACIESKRLPDDCYELTTLRNFRDTWLSSTEEGKAIIKQYYAIAPSIVTAINKSDNNKAVYDSIYNEMVIPCVKLIRK